MDFFNNNDSVPYPKIEHLKQDYKFGRMLYNSFSGSASELTTVLQYINENISNETSPELKNVLMKIAIQEMHHLKILGDILVKLGFIPYYMSSRNNKWCSDNIKYKFKCVEDMLKYNIEGEKMAIREYQKLIENTEEKCIKDTLCRIIQDEENHIRIFESLLPKD